MDVLVLERNGRDDLVLVDWQYSFHSLTLSYVFSLWLPTYSLCFLTSSSTLFFCAPTLLLHLILPLLLCLGTVFPKHFSVCVHIFHHPPELSFLKENINKRWFTGCMVPPATITALLSCTTLLKFTAGFNSRNLMLDVLKRSGKWIWWQSRKMFYLSASAFSPYTTTTTIIMNIPYTPVESSSSSSSSFLPCLFTTTLPSTSALVRASKKFSMKCIGDVKLW